MKKENKEKQVAIHNIIRFSLLILCVWEWFGFSFKVALTIHNSKGPRKMD